ncbi:MAG TPA: cyclic nucleotide-binding domain-containing protein [Elusimicrobiales bacterium]|nr:cyclic nucleotide-binding domain-containing protein [Elusimicrobiales bacterium]
MSEIEKLRGVTLFHNLSESMLSEFAGYFKQTAHAAGEVIFKEKTKGDTLYIIVDGEVTIEKALDEVGNEFKALAILSSGDFFGEMAVLEGQRRFAQARATRDSALYEIGRAQLFAFIKDHPDTGISIFSEIMKTLLKRLQHTSNELTMLFDLSRQLMTQHKSPAEFLAVVMDEMRPYLEGSWNIHAFAYNVFNDEYDPVYTRENFLPDKPVVPPASPESGWLNGSTYVMACSAEGRRLACALFTKAGEVNLLEKNNLATIFNTISSIISSAMVNIEHQAEAMLLAKLKQAKI